MRTRITVALLITAIVLLSGTIAFHFLEGWSLVDSFYFTGMTVMTIGYGDLVPTHNVSKVFTVFFAMIGIGIIFVIFFSVIKFYLLKEEEIIARKIKTYRERMKK